MESADIGGNECAPALKRRFSTNMCAPNVDTSLLSSAADHEQDREQQPKTKQRKRDEQSEFRDTPRFVKLAELEPNLLNFCDELLYEIFKYLDSSSMLAVMHCSPRLENLLLDHRFWHRIDLSNGPLPLGILEDILGRATEKTHTIKICGPPSSQHVAGEGKQFTCTLTTVFPKVSTHLRELALQGVSLDFEYIHISEFPASLKSLKLKDCSVKVGDQVKSIFHTIEKQLVELEDLSIEDNNWFEPYYIMALSKLPALRRLSLKGCQMLCKFVPYGSMAARFGFQKLEVLDLRLTPINNSDLQCFSAIENLKELLLESPPNLPTAVSSDDKSVPEKPNNEASGSEEAAAANIEKTLNDDEPSTSRRAMEHLRACKTAQPNDQGSENVAATDEPTLNLDNCNEKEAEQQPQNRHSESDDDEDTSTTSASSSDKSDNAQLLNNCHDANGPVRSPLVVIALPSVAPVQPEPAGPDVPDVPAEPLNAVPDDNAQAARPIRVGPRAFIYMPNEDHAHENPGPRPNMVALLEQMADQFQTWRGNYPAHSRFLPRRDQIIYPQAIVREPPMHVRRRRMQHRGNFDQVLHHPMFWNMLDPLDREHGRRVRNRAQNHCPVQPQCYVSDRAIYSFGRAARPVQPDVVWIRNINRSPDNRLERISLRNYQNITNNTLDHLVQCSPNLVYIDVSGTSINLEGLRMFKKVKPNCEVVATHLTDVDDVDEIEEKETVSSVEQTESASPSPPEQAEKVVEP